MIRTARLGLAGATAVLALGAGLVAPVRPASAADLACPTAGQCTAVDSRGYEVTFDPLGSAPPTSRPIASGDLGMAVACPSASQCTAIEYPLGDEGRSTTEVTFNPVIAGGERAEASSPRDRISCVSTEQCTTAAGTQELTFNPLTGGRPAASVVDEHEAVEYPWGCSPFGYTPCDVKPAAAGISCPSAVQCTLVDTSGFESTFDPLRPGEPVPVKIARLYLCGGHCPWDGGPTALACPSLRRCTAVIDNGNWVTFDPEAGAGGNGLVRSEVTVEYGWPVFTGVACVSETSCTEVDSWGQAAAFNPAVAKSTVLAGIDAERALSGVACPAVSECVALEASDGGAVVFEPGSLHTVRRIQLEGEPPPAAPTPTPTGAARVTGAGRVSRGAVTIRLQCSLEGPCAGVLSVLLAKRVGHGRSSRTVHTVLGSARFALGSGRAGSVRIRLKAAGLALMRRAARRGLLVQVAGGDLVAGSIRLRD